MNFPTMLHRNEEKQSAGKVLKAHSIRTRSKEKPQFLTVFSFPQHNIHRSRAYASVIRLYVYISALCFIFTQRNWAECFRGRVWIEYIQFSLVPDGSFKWSDACTFVFPPIAVVGFSSAQFFFALICCGFVVVFYILYVKKNLSQTC